MSTFDISTAADAHRNAYNAAFNELGLRFFWNSEHYNGALCENGERDCLRRYLEQHQAHLLRAYDADFLVDATGAAKERCYRAMTAEGCRPGAAVNWAEIAQHPIGA